MLKILTSLSFLYAIAILVLLIYGFFYYRDFKKGMLPGKRFPLVFIFISLACLSFLWINIHAPLRLKTFSILDHHFIRHDGFDVLKKIELGGTDTVKDVNRSYNRFLFLKKDGAVIVKSVYSEEPLYGKTDDVYKILSPNYPAVGHSMSFTCDGLNISISATDDKGFELKVGPQIFKSNMPVKRGVSCWNIFQSEDGFINSAYLNNEKLVSCLKNILMVRDDISGKRGKELNYFLSGRLFQYAENVKYNNTDLQLTDQEFHVSLPDQSIVTWGVGFLESNRNQYKIRYDSNDHFSLINSYPVSYPMSEENHNDWSLHYVTKFLLSDAKDIHKIPAVFREGFLFSGFGNDQSNYFSPLLVFYKNKGRNDSLQIQVQSVEGTKKNIELKNAKFLLPARSKEFNWSFSLNNTYSWKFENQILSSHTWERLIFGSLIFFILLVLFSSWVIPATERKWIGQLLSCVTLVLLTTRFFLYWRYKSFPPYEGMDHPAQQQLESFSNFGIIILATISMALIFGFPFLKYGGRTLSKIKNRFLSKPIYNSDHKKKQDIKFIHNFLNKYNLFRGSKRILFFFTWTLVLIICGAIAAISQFNPGICRHLAIVLMIAYFVFLFYSYTYSPLFAQSENSWWKIGTVHFLDIIISNPVKIILSVSLLALFSFIDIGFAIVFLNFLLFNEAFLCINYSIAGLSAGSKTNSRLFGLAGMFYLVFFVMNLFYAPYVFKYLLQMPESMFTAGFVILGIGLAGVIVRLIPALNLKKKILIGFATASILFCFSFFLFPKERILDKAAMTKYRIDVLTVPVDEAIGKAYEEGKTYEPVIRAAQNQWFINTFIYEKNNPDVQTAGFHLLPHAPQNKGAKYNAQATDLVTSRFLIAEHGKGSVILYMLLLMLPVLMLASFYQLYPDFTNRTNNHYPSITVGFSLLNYLVITALLVILAATGRYIFFGQDLPFGSILSKQSILFPCLLIIAVIFFFKNIPQEYYANRKKIVPGFFILLLLTIFLFLFKPAFNKNKDFAVGNLAKEMNSYIQSEIQPILEFFDTASAFKKFTIAKKDGLFSDSLRKMISAGTINSGNSFYASELKNYSRSGFTRHRDQRRMLYLDVYSGTLQLSVNENYFRVDPPPHLQQLWTGNVYGDTSVYNISLWNANDGSVVEKRMSHLSMESGVFHNDLLQLSFKKMNGDSHAGKLYLHNNSRSAIILKSGNSSVVVPQGESFQLGNPGKFIVLDSAAQVKQVLTIEPDAFMKNYFVNGSRYYMYPLKERFVWARNFAEAISSDYSATGAKNRNAFVSLDFEIMDSLTTKIKFMMLRDTAYKRDAEYGISVADGNGRLIAMADFIKGVDRPDPNDKAAFNKILLGENGFVTQSLLRKQVGNINLLRLNPGPGSTFKPIVFSAIASQLNLNWDEFATTGFSEKQNYFGGEKVKEYDFEKNNGRVNNVKDYLRLSDNYYHSNVLLLGSYPKQDPDHLLADHFNQKKQAAGLQWPYFTYTGKQYWLNGFQNWPGYSNGKANFGTDSSFTSVGLLNNFNICTHQARKSFDMFSSSYDSLLFLNAYRKSGFILPEYSLFDQQGDQVNHRIPYDLFSVSFRGHVKGSSQVMISPAKMAEAFGKLISQNRNYCLTLNPWAESLNFSAFEVDPTLSYNSYLSIIRQNVFLGMREALFIGTASKLGNRLKDGTPYYYYAKTGTTGDDERKTKSKLLAVIISSKNVTDPDFNFRENKFYTVYFSSQNSPPSQNEEFQAEVIEYLKNTFPFVKYMHAGK